jgi:hypothetical protein
MKRFRADPINRDILYSPVTIDAINNKYPDFDQAKHQVAKSKNVKELAVSPKIHLARDEIGLVKIHYFGTPVALLSSLDKVLVPEKYMLYTDLLEAEVPGLKCEIME